MSEVQHDDRIIWFMMPAGEPEMVAKSPRFKPDVIIPCLEDGVAYSAEAKAAARQSLSEVIASGAVPRDQIQLFPRINHVTGPYWRDDIEAALDMGSDGIVIPKTESAEDVRIVSSQLHDCERRRDIEPGSTEVVCMVETTKGVWYAQEIASADPRVVALLFGREDFSASLGHMRRHADSARDRSLEFLYARSQVVMASRVAGVGSIDGPTFTFADEEFMKDDASLAARLGFTGKLCAHPAQARATEYGFSPVEEDVEAAREILELEQKALASGDAAVGAVRGMEVTPPIVDQARLLMARREWASRRAEG